jgi:muramoyltetrapeptide carboxypeptidase LdcA involved in peptidoglycan recycling
MVLIVFFIILQLMLLLFMLLHDWIKIPPFNDIDALRNEGMYLIVQGQASGTIIGSNIVSFQALQGTEYFPSLQNSILFLEDDYELKPHHFDRALQSLCLLPDFKHVKGLVIGRSQKVSGITKELLHKIITTKKNYYRFRLLQELILVIQAQ